MRNIRRGTRNQYGVEEKIRILLEGLRCVRHRRSFCKKNAEEPTVPKLCGEAQVVFMQPS